MSDVLAGPELAGMVALPLLLDEYSTVVHFLFLQRHAEAQQEQEEHGDREEEADEEEMLVDGEGSAAARSSRGRRGTTLMVSNLPPFVSASALHALFSDCGAIRSVRFTQLQKPEVRKQLKALRDRERNRRKVNTVKAHPDLNVYRGRTFAEGGGTGGDVPEVEPKRSAATLAVERVSEMQGSGGAVEGDGDRAVRLLYGGNALIRFVEEQGVESALRLPQTILDSNSYPTLLPHGDASERLGLTEHLSSLERAHKDARLLQSRVDLFMSEFDLILQEERAQKEEKTAVEAEDGWTVVHHKKGTSRVVLKGRKKRVTKDFYRFQVRSQREDRMTELRKRFENDKLRIARMKGNRKFKPF